jgi:DNA-directed RNA polymerase subunit RPC12/RpoP
VWWICSKGHEWHATILSRNKGSGCPYCSNKATCEDNCLMTANPILSKEWNSTKNGSLTPKDVTPGSNKKVWWICSKGHEWETKVSHRSKGSRCPYCSRKA